MSQQITLDVGWGKLAAIAYGPEGGHPVLALHGWLDNAATFERLVPFLPKDLRLVSLDLPGHGLSDHRPPGVTYHFIDSIVDVATAVDALGWDRYSMLGHSLGGGIASLVAGTFPDRVKKLALVEALGPLSWEAMEGPARLRSYYEERSKMAAKQPPVYTDPKLAIEARRKAGPISADAATILVERALKQVPGGYTWRTDPRLRLPSAARFSEDQVMAFLKKIVCPTLVIRAAAGLPFEERLWSLRSRVVAHLSVVSLPGNHHLHLEQPEDVGSALSDFFEMS